MILVLNAGSSSLKYALFDGAVEVDRGVVERIGEPDGDAPDHHAAMTRVANSLGLAGLGLTAVGHRIVHGGARFEAPTVVDDEVLAAIRDLVPLAPLHNPAGVATIEAARTIRPDVPHVAVFDTAFHATLPPVAYTYALDATAARRYGIRRYGFHGTSHRYVSRRAASLLGRPVEELNLIVLHLGNGASATAVAGGRSVETSMGFTPLEGLVMGTRTGDIDPAVVFHLALAGMSIVDIEDVFEHRSGLRGLCGDNDVRAVEARAAGCDAVAKLALDVYCYRVRKYVGAYHAVLGRLDGIVFTAGVGEHSAVVREWSLAGLESWGIRLDPERNAGTGQRVISAETSTVAVCVVPTDEERAIAAEVSDLVG